MKILETYTEDGGHLKLSKKTTEINKSAHFILPLLGITKNYRGFINSYLQVVSDKHTAELDNNDDTIYVNLQDYDDILREIRGFISCDKLKNGTYLYKFKIPEVYHKEYLLFLEGKYSKFSDEAKEILCLSSRQRNRRIEDSSIYKILFKTPDRRKYIENLIGEKLRDEDEVASIVNLSKEILFYDR